MASVLVGLAGLALAIVALLAVPVSLAVDAEWADERRAKWRLRWLFGLVDIERKPRRSSSEPDRAAKPSKLDRERSTRPRTRSTKGLAVGLAVARSDGFMRRTLRLLQELVRSIRFDDLYARVAFGLDDPADTGRLYGMIAPVCLAANLAGADVSCQPLFTQPGLAGACGGRVEVRPLAICGVFLRFLCSPPTLRAMRAAWESRR